MDMTITARLIVKGFTQGIGYKAYIKENAIKLKIKGSVKNLQDNSVEIYCDAPNDETYEKFKKMLTNEDSESTIEEIEEYFEDSEEYGTGPEQWIGFNILRDEFSSIDESLEFMVRSGRKLMKTQDRMMDEQDQTLKTQNKMLEQDIKEMKEAFTKLVDHFVKDD